MTTIMITMIMATGMTMVMDTRMVTITMAMGITTMRPRTSAAPSPSAPP